MGPKVESAAAQKAKLLADGFTTDLCLDSSPDPILKKDGSAMNTVLAIDDDDFDESLDLDGGYSVMSPIRLVVFAVVVVVFLGCCVVSAVFFLSESSSLRPALFSS